MTAKREQHPGGGTDRGKRGELLSSDKLIPTGDPDEAAAAAPPPERFPPGKEPRGVQKGIADADKVARTGSTEEPVRNTPPAGPWNDTSSD